MLNGEVFSFNYLREAVKHFLQLTSGRHHLANDPISFCNIFKSLKRKGRYNYIMVSAQKPNINRSDAVRDKVGEEGKVILKRQSEFIMLAPDHSIFRSCITFLLSLLFTGDRVTHG